MAGMRNSFGVNNTTDCYRTGAGEKYIGWGGGMPQPGSQPTGPLECAAAGLDESDGAAARDDDSLAIVELRAGACLYSKGNA